MLVNNPDPVKIKDLMKKLSQKNALNKLLNILRKHDLIFKSTNQKLIEKLFDYEHLTLKVRDNENSEAFLYFQIEHPDYNNLDYVSDYRAPHAGFCDRINGALEEWESKTENTALTH